MHRHSHHDARADAMGCCFECVCAMICEIFHNPDLPPDVKILLIVVILAVSIGAVVLFLAASNTSSSCTSTGGCGHNGLNGVMNLLGATSATSTMEAEGVTENLHSAYINVAGFVLLLLVWLGFIRKKSNTIDQEATDSPSAAASSSSSGIVGSVQRGLAMPFAPFTWNPWLATFFSLVFYQFALSPFVQLGHFITFENDAYHVSGQVLAYIGVVLAWIVAVRVHNLRTLAIFDDPPPIYGMVSDESGAAGEARAMQPLREQQPPSYQHSTKQEEARSSSSFESAPLPAIVPWTARAYFVIGTVCAIIGAGVAGHQLVHNLQHDSATPLSFLSGLIVIVFLVATGLKLHCLEALLVASFAIAYQGVSFCVAAFSVIVSAISTSTHLDKTMVLTGMGFSTAAVLCYISSIACYLRDGVPTQTKINVMTKSAINTGIQLVGTIGGCLLVLLGMVIFVIGLSAPHGTSDDPSLSTYVLATMYSQLAPLPIMGIVALTRMSFLLRPDARTSLPELALQMAVFLGLLFVVISNPISNLAAFSHDTDDQSSKTVRWAQVLTYVGSFILLVCMSCCNGGERAATHASSHVPTASRWFMFVTTVLGGIIMLAAGTSATDSNEIYSRVPAASMLLIIGAIIGMAFCGTVRLAQPVALAVPVLMSMVLFHVVNAVDFGVAATTGNDRNAIAVGGMFGVVALLLQWMLCAHLSRVSVAPITEMTGLLTASSV